ncbi:amidohydrolase, partial [Acidobacteriota bacterium]
SLALGLKVLSSFGITSVVEAGSVLGSVTRIYQAVYDSGKLPVRAVIYDGWYRSGEPRSLGDPAKIGERIKALGFHNIGNNMFRIRGAKSSADGGIGSRSAAVSKPYLPIPEDPLGEKNYGSFRDPDFNHRLAQFHVLADFGWELHTHACGDAAIRQTMDVYKILMDKIRKDNPEADLRWSIIHAYIPDEPGTSVITEMAKYGVIAAINPSHIYFEGDSFLRNIGPERMSRHTPFKTFLDAWILMASGSDYPNNSPDPWLGMYAMCTRKHQISGEAYGQDQCLSFLEALKTFTINGAAYLTFNDDVRGSIEAGKLADLVILEADLLNVSNEELLEMHSNVLLTMVDGKIMYQKPNFVLK